MSEEVRGGFGKGGRGVGEGLGGSGGRGSPLMDAAIRPDET